MNTNRILGIFISVTILMWILIFALSPQPKYQQKININIPELPKPLVNQDSFKDIEFIEVKNDSFEAQKPSPTPVVVTLAKPLTIICCAVLVD